ncbi:RNA polymerase sigma factor [Lapillicoccus jejuensis]|uniref:RNA polymerase sigma factor n=1 Tax=Lapillicoccus jejuensis TaxID=402171 RepID=UPI001FE86529|nr:sigma-70 family RNA polymerase sigma factor [Lapillicoccus jejuensis]
MAPQVTAALVRRYGDVDRAEDAVQEALLAADRQWPLEGLPDDPKAWLVRVASRRLVDAWRSDTARAAREDRLVPRGGDLVAPPADHPDRSAHDDSLVLLLLCCHPALTRPSQVALTLRVLAGLSTAQVARALLVPETTMAQRISRAKATLRELDAPFAPPAAAELPDRVAAVTQVLYLVFTEGHAATTGDRVTDVSLAQEAIRLTRDLHRWLPEDDEVTGLLALMLLSHARRRARTTPYGDLVPLAEQDRRLWDAGLVAEGLALVEEVLPRGRVGAYQLQAAIAAVHAEAPSSQDTDWAQVAALYAMLADVAPSPVVTLNRAVAVAEVDGPTAGLAMVEPLVEHPALRRGHRVHAVRAHLLERAGRREEAREAFVRAADLATSTPEQRHLRRLAQALTDPPSG